MAYSCSMLCGCITVLTYHISIEMFRLCSTEWYFGLTTEKLSVEAVMPEVALWFQYAKKLTHYALVITCTGFFSKNTFKMHIANITYCNMQCFVMWTSFIFIPMNICMSHSRNNYPALCAWIGYVYSLDMEMQFIKVMKTFTHSIRTWVVYTVVQMWWH